MSKGNVREQRRRYRERYPEKVAAHRRNYRNTHREEIRLRENERRRRRTSEKSIIPGSSEWNWEIGLRRTESLNRRPGMVFAEKVESVLGSFGGSKGWVLMGREIDRKFALWARENLGEAKLVQLAETGQVGIKREGCWLDFDYCPGKFLRVTRTPKDGRRERLTWWDVDWMGSDPQMMDVLLAMIGCRLQSWHGPAAVASTWMRDHRVKEHLAPVPADVADVAQRAYFGGDIRCLRVGTIEGPVQKFDLNSAYAWALSQMPSFTEGRWVNSAVPSPASPWGIHHVSWEVGVGRGNPLQPLTPFPWRGADGLVCYPPSGQGWYWTPLIMEALRLWGPERIKVYGGGWTFYPDSDTRPFAFLEDIYRYRAKCEPSELSDVLKVAMSAVYGKLVQEPGRWGNPYHHIAAAGLCTSLVRARMLAFAGGHPERLLSALTDCLWLRGERTGPGGCSALGAWRHTPLDGFSSFSPNFYAERKGERWEIHAAGVEAGSIKGFGGGELAMAVGSRRVLWTPALCHAQGKWENLGKVIEEPVELRCTPSGGFSYPDEFGPVVCWQNYDMANTSHYATTLSAPYRRLDK